MYCSRGACACIGLWPADRAVKYALSAPQSVYCCYQHIILTMMYSSANRKQEVHCSVCSGASSSVQ